MAEKVPGWIGRILLPQLGEIKGEIVGLNGKVDGLAGRLEVVEGKLDGVEGRLQRVEGKLEAVEGKLEAVQERMWGEFAAVHTDIKRLDEKMSVEIRRLDEKLDLADKISDIAGRVATLEARK